jgi:hypothetical protein
MEVDRSYASTQAGTCDGRLILDGRTWDSELPPPYPVPPMHVWVSISPGDGAGFISPNGVVGIAADTGRRPAASSLAV